MIKDKCMLILKWFLIAIIIFVFYGIISDYILKQSRIDLRHVLECSSRLFQLQLCLDDYQRDNNKIYPDNLKNFLLKEKYNLAILLMRCPEAYRQGMKKNELIYIKPRKNYKLTDILVYSPLPLYRKNGKDGYMVLRINKVIEFVEKTSFEKELKNQLKSSVGVGEQGVPGKDKAQNKNDNSK